MPEKPREEIVVSLAGLAVDVAIAAVLILGASPELGSPQSLESPGSSLLAQLAAIDLFLVLFNLIPALPMDGGRVHRALLAIRRGPVEATNIALRIGQALAFGLGLLGLFGNSMLLFIAIFVYAAARAEAQATDLANVLRRLGVRDAMITKFETLGLQATVEDAVECLLRTTHHEFPLVDGVGRLRGVLTRSSIIQALSWTGSSTPVVDGMQHDVPSVPLRDQWEAALRHLPEGGKPVVAVDRRARALGRVRHLRERGRADHGAQGGGSTWFKSRSPASAAMMAPPMQPG